MTFTFADDGDIISEENCAGRRAIMSKEKTALGRVLTISRYAYTAISKGDEDINAIALLDCLSAVLSHCNHSKQPISWCMWRMKSNLKHKNKPFFIKMKPYLASIYPIMDYDFERASRHIPAMIYGNDRICDMLSRGEFDKARSMADAMHNYPGYLFGEFEALSGEQFYELVFGYYPKLYDEPFMDEMKGLFSDK